MTGRARSRRIGFRVDFTTCPCPRRKRAYATRREARLARHELHDPTLHVYRCPVSNLWHLGHPYPDRTPGDPS